MLKLFIDSDSDFTLEQAKEWNATMISMPYEIKGKEVKPYVDFEKFNGKEYYDTLRKGVIPTTSALNPEDYIQYFEPEFKAGNDIFYVHFSAAMTATFNSMRLALEELKEIVTEFVNSQTEAPQEQQINEEKVEQVEQINDEKEVM